MPRQMQPSKDDIRKLVHTPPEVARDFVAWAERRKSEPGIPWGVPKLDRHFLPMYPGDLITILGRPGHGKSSLLAYLARAHSERLRQEGNSDKCVVYCTWESTVEELANFLLANTEYSVTDVARGAVPIDVVQRQSNKLVSNRIFIIGRGIGRIDTVGLRMTPEIVWRIIETMHEDFGVRPALMLFDYLQLIPSESHRDRKEQIAEAPIRIKELAQTVGAPAVCAVQASRTVDSYKVKVPRVSDAQWSSSIEQTSDKMLGLWRPILTETAGEPLKGEDGQNAKTKGGGDIIVEETLLVIKKLKERYNSGSAWLNMHFAPQWLRLTEMELEQKPVDNWQREEYAHVTNHLS